MVRDITERLRLPEDQRVFEFHLCHKQTSLAEMVIDQFWMPIKTLYGQRNRSAINQQAIIDFWWGVCNGHGTHAEARVQESYILAKILPHARSNGSRRVFVDSFQTVPDDGHRKMRVWVRELNQLITESRHEEFDKIAFRDSTADLIGPPFYSDDVWKKYRQMESDLFGEGREAIQQGESQTLDAVLNRWKALMNSIGRRRGNPLEKNVLDILSYECRTALHRCYSAVWWVLFPVLNDRYSLSEESFVFHQLWHLDRCEESDYGDQSYFHLFHGHIFSLHPASGPLLMTEAGGELFSEWLAEGTLSSYHRVLHALAVAVGYYDQQHDIAALLRKKDGAIETVGDMVTLEEREVERRSGRRRFKELDD